MCVCVEYFLQNYIEKCRFVPRCNKGSPKNKAKITAAGKMGKVEKKMPPIIVT